MDLKSPRIYTYKITFEEVPYYYYGSKKERYYDQNYFGSPVTNKWCWELYTPKKQILELFDFTDEGYKECLRVEGRLIKPVLNDCWCLNESCGGNYSLATRRKSGKKTYELGKGIYGRTKEQIIKDTIKAGEKTYELGKGICGRSKEQMSEDGTKGGKRSKELNVGIHGRSKEQMSENGKKGGAISGNQKWKCLETGFITNAGNLTQYQRARGIDTSQRVRVAC